MNKKRIARLLAASLIISSFSSVVSEAAGTWKNGYYLENNRKASGLKRVDKYYYYFSNGKPLKSKWKTVGKSKYYFDKNGRAITGLRRLNGKLYYFNSKGAMLKSSWKTVKNKKYYFGSYGFAVTGLKKIGSGYYLFKKDGSLYTNTGIINYNKKKYLLAKGKVRLGLQNYKGGLYYFTTKGMHTGWKTIKGTKFYFSPSSGRAYKGRTYTINGKKYRFSSGGQLIVTTEKPVTPSKPETPATEAPSTEKPSTPSTEAPNKPETPSTETPSTPSTEAPSKPETPSTEAPSKPETPSTEKKQKYTYSIERYNPNGYGLYDKNVYVLYVKTEAPIDYFWIEGDFRTIVTDFYDVRYPKNAAGSKIVSSSVPYKDGYLITVSFNHSGHQKITIKEVGPNGNRYYNYIECSENVYFDVLDFDHYEEAYLRKVINNVTTSGMTDLEKVKAVQEYIFYNFKYNDSDTGYTKPIQSVKELGARFETKKIVCTDSTAMMDKVADIIGLKWRNLDRTSGPWMNAAPGHVWTSVFYDGKWYDVDACPNVYSGNLIDLDNVEYIN